MSSVRSSLRQKNILQFTLWSQQHSLESYNQCNSAQRTQQTKARYLTGQKMPTLLNCFTSLTSPRLILSIVFEQKRQLSKYFDLWPHLVEGNNGRLLGDAQLTQNIDLAYSSHHTPWNQNYQYCWCFSSRFLDFSLTCASLEGPSPCLHLENYFETVGMKIECLDMLAASIPKRKSHRSIHLGLSI